MTVDIIVLLMSDTHLKVVDKVQSMVLLHSLNISVSVRGAGRLQLGTQPVCRILMSAAFLTSPVQPTLLSPATTPRDPSTVEPVPWVCFIRGHVL